MTAMQKTAATTAIAVLALIIVGPKLGITIGQ
jgi:hypothetical protein